MTTPTCRRLLLWLCICLALAGRRTPPAAAQSVTRLAPMGGGYSDVYAGFCAAAAANAKDGVVRVVVLPTPYSTNPEKISDAERATNLRDAEERRFQTEQACQRAAPQLASQAVLAPVFTRSDAADPAVIALFSDDLSAVFILGGDQTVAMLALADTPVEAALDRLYRQGVVVGGTSAGGGMLSQSMLGGYNLNFAAANALDFGAADLWRSAQRRGLAFGVQGAVLDQHFFQRSRVGRLLNAIALPGAPHIGIGVDAYTGLNITGGSRLENIFGLYVVTVLDAETYHAADGVRYRGAGYTLSLRNVLVHTLAPGSSSYDLVKRAHSLGPPAERVERDLTALRLPPGAGPLILSGGLEGDLAAHPVLAELIRLSGGAQARLLVIAAGYPSDASAKRAADRLAAALDSAAPAAPAQTLVIGKDAADPPGIPPGITGIVLTGRDQSLINPAALPDLKAAWLAGIPLLADNAAAAILGEVYSAHPPTPDDAEGAELATQKSFLQGRTTLKPGLGLAPACFEPQLLEGNRWGRLFSLAYGNPRLPAFGLSEDAAIILAADGAAAGGSGVVIGLDLRQAQLALGSNQGYVIANGLLDVYAPGDRLEAAPADVSILPQGEPTPALPSLPTPTAALPSATLTAVPPADTALPPAATATAPAPTAAAPTDPVAGSVTAAAQPPASPTTELEPPPPSGSLAAILSLAAVIVGVIVYLVTGLRRRRSGR